MGSAQSQRMEVLDAMMPRVTALLLPAGVSRHEQEHGQSATQEHDADYRSHC
jgi:hypothetical protein